MKQVPHKHRVALARCPPVGQFMIRDLEDPPSAGMVAELRKSGLLKKVAKETRDGSYRAIWEMTEDGRRWRKEKKSKFSQ